jgi:hypothetical protein
MCSLDYGPHFPYPSSRNLFFIQSDFEEKQNRNLSEIFDFIIMLNSVQTIVCRHFILHVYRALYLHLMYPSTGTSSYCYVHLMPAVNSTTYNYHFVPCAIAHPFHECAMEERRRSLVEDSEIGGTLSAPGTNAFLFSSLKYSLKILMGRTSRRGHHRRCRRRCQTQPTWPLVQDRCAHDRT